MFNTVPLGRNGGGLGKGATDHVDKLIAEGWNLLMFPEGTRSRDGELGKVRSGAAVLAAQHGLEHRADLGRRHARRDAARPVLAEAAEGAAFSRRVQLEVRFGSPITPEDPSERREVMALVRAFWEREGRPEDSDVAPTAEEILESLRARKAAEADAGGEEHSAAA